MTQERKAAEDHQETRGPVQQEDLRVVLPRITEVRAATSVTPPRFLRQLPPTPAPPGSNSSAVARSTRECQRHTFSYHIPPPPALRSVPPALDADATELNADSDVNEPTQMLPRTKMMEMQGRSAIDRDVGELRSHRVLVPKSSRSTRPLPLIPKATSATASTYGHFVESSEKAVAHDGASSPSSLATPSPLSLPGPNDVPLGLNWDATPGIDRESGRVDRDSSGRGRANGRGTPTSSRVSYLDGRNVAGMFNDGQSTTINGGQFYHIQGDVYDARGSSDSAHERSQYKAVYARAQPSVSLPPAALLEILELLIANVIRHLEAQAHDSAFEDPSERTSQDDDGI